jgi:uncharacterized protein (TIGR02391 family)
LYEKSTFLNSIVDLGNFKYLQQNYFHAVFEIAKSLSEKVRSKTGLQEDGPNLFNLALTVNNPKLALNSLETSSQKNEQNGQKCPCT